MRVLLAFLAAASACSSGLPMQDATVPWDAVDQKLKPLWIAKDDPRPPSLPSASEREKLSAFVEQTVKRWAAEGAEKPPTLSDALAQAGWVVDRIPYRDETLWLLHEKESDRKGRGALLLRPSKLASNRVIQVPHRFFDMHTSEIGRPLFLHAGAFAYMENTAHRLWGKSSDAKYGPTDSAHTKDSGFQAMTAGLAKALKGATFVQVHGFDHAGDGEDEPAESMIVSDGTGSPGEAARKLAEELKEATYKVRLYGKDVQKLGGTTNVQGELVRGEGHQFLHVEMTLPLRKRLKQNASDLEALSRALVKALEK